MTEMITNLGTTLSNIYISFTSGLPPYIQTFIALFVFALLVLIYSLFIWWFYRFIAKKNIIYLNLNKYNRSEHPFLSKLFAGFLYFIEYLLLLPIWVFIWFGLFTLFLIFLTDGIPIETVLFISAVIVAAIRMTSYHSEDLSKDLAKLLPFTVLAVSITKVGFFDIQRIFSNFAQLGEFISSIWIYFVFVMALEIILRFFDFIISLFGVEKAAELPPEQ